MPARTDPDRSRQEDLGFGAFDDLYKDFDSDDDVFASEPESGVNKKKRREPEVDGLGITEEVNVKKRATVPRVKLDEERLLSANGIPKLRKRAAGLKLKGKGHEFSDAARLLSFYQLWLDDLFPKAKFLDALAMVEKAGHKTILQMQRVEWINEGKPKRTSDDLFEEGEEIPGQQSAPQASTTVAPIFDQQLSGRHKTPAVDDPFGDGGIFGVSPARGPAGASSIRDIGDEGGAPDEDDFDALMAEAETQGPPAPVGSLFGSGMQTTLRRAPEQDPDDDLDAMIAEAEIEGVRKLNRSGQVGKGLVKKAETSVPDGDFDDLDNLIAEAEAQPKAKGGGVASKPSGDDLLDEEEAMAKVDGLR